MPAKQNIVLNLILDARGVQAGLKKTEVGLRRVGKEAQRTRDTFIGLRRVYRAYAFAITAGATIAAGVRQFTTFETILAQTGGLLQASKEDVRKLKKEILDLSVAFGRPAQEQARAFYNVISAGIEDIGKAQEIVAVSNKVAIGGVASVNEVAEGIAGVVNAFRSIDYDIDDIADIFFIIEQGGQVTIPELVRNLGKLGPEAALASTSLSEVGAAIATLTAGGIPTALAVFQMRSLLRSLTSPPKGAV